MMSMVVVFGVDSELVSDQYDRFGGWDPMPERAS